MSGPSWTVCVKGSSTSMASDKTGRKLVDHLTKTAVKNGAGADKARREAARMVEKAEKKAKEG